ncbi:MAG: helix-turn-helix domain-containing protein [Candidatus Anstonellaceae archaeon]
MASYKQSDVLLQKKANTNDGLVELCRMMRLMSERDTDATLPQVLKIMLLEARDRPVGGSELSRASGINRITILHHLRRLEAAGFVRRINGKYIMRVQSAEEMILEFRKEMEEAFSQMDELAREIDAHFAEIEKQYFKQNKRKQM